MFPFDPGPEASDEAAEEEALCGEEASGEPVLEEADAGPGRGDRARHKHRRAECAGEEVMYGRDRKVVEATKAWQEES